MFALAMIAQVKGGEDKEGDSDNNTEEEPVFELSDSSPAKTTEKHKPAELEAELAALLLAKEPDDVDKVVADVEDSDYPFFESVLIANRKV